MPIGTSDGEHFEDAFQQALSMQQSQMHKSPYIPPINSSSDSVEDRRGEHVPDVVKAYPGSFEFGAKELPPQKQMLHSNNPEEMSHYRDVGKHMLQDKMIEHYWQSTPGLAEALNNPQIDRSHEVPYIAGASKDPKDFTTHVDKSVPASVTISGKTFDPAIPLSIHEQIEREVMQKLIKGGMKSDRAYQIAHHEYAQVAEDNWYRQQGIDVNEVDKFWSKINTKTEKDKGDFPPNLYKKPYPHDQVKGEKHTPSDVFKEWPISKAE